MKMEKTLLAAVLLVAALVGLVLVEKGRIDFDGSATRVAASTLVEPAVAGEAVINAQEAVYAATLDVLAAEDRLGAVPAHAKPAALRGFEAAMERARTAQAVRDGIVGATNPTQEG